MSQTPTTDDHSRWTDLAADRMALLSNPRTRLVVRTLHEQTGRLPVPDLATLVASTEADVGLDAVTDDQRQAVQTSLHHHHLPKLRAESVVTIDEGAVALTDDPATSGTVRQTFALPLGDELTDTVLDVLASDQRQVVVEILEPDGELAVSELVSTVATRTGRAESEIRVTLQHTHLPKLADADIVAFDRDARRVRYNGIPVDLGRDQTGGDEGDDGGNGGTETGEIRTIHGRELIVTRGQDLFDYAEEELFLMVTTDGLLEPTCIEKLHDAVDRGVDVYLGSQTRAVRDLIRRQAPSVTIWEPQLNWLNLPPSGETLGRLVMADREAVLLGTLGEDDDVPTERALTGEGPANPLVVLMREMLGRRLDHLDGQSEDVLSQLPL